MTATRQHDIFCEGDRVLCRRCGQSAFYLPCPFVSDEALKVEVKTRKIELEEKRFRIIYSAVFSATLVAIVVIVYFFFLLGKIPTAITETYSSIAKDLHRLQTACRSEGLFGVFNAFRNIRPQA